MKILTNILNPIDVQTAELLDNHVIEIEKGKITNISPLTKDTKKSQLKNFSKSIFTPALIDAHTHLPQLSIIGSYGYKLMDWLNNHTFPAEIEFEKAEHAKKTSKEFFKELKKVGTATAVIYSSIHKKSTDIAFSEAEKTKLRIFMGKTMMNQNCPKELCENAIQSLSESYELQKKWHKKNKNLQYIYSPRFAISTSPELMKEAGKLSRINKTFLQTHINENKDEINFVKKTYSKSYTQVYEEAKILGPNTLLAHAIHNTKEDLDILEKTQTNIIHCPDANLFLKSGKFPLEKIQERDIQIGLGSDVGAGTTLDMFQIMKSMIYVQEKNIPIETPFYYATKGNAKILKINSGEITKGKRAEFLKVDIQNKPQEAKEVLNKLIFTQNYERELLIY